MSEKVLVGHIGVDAGIVWVGDPCYILHTEEPLPNSLGKDWSEFCSKIGDSHPTMISFPYELGHEGLGVCVSSGLGDGFYPVYVEIDNVGGWGKRIKSLTVEFISDES